MTVGPGSYWQHRLASHWILSKVALPRPSSSTFLQFERGSLPQAELNARMISSSSGGGEPRNGNYSRKKASKSTAIASSAIHPSFHHRDEISIADSITCFWYRFAFPAALRPDSVENIHQPPLGLEEATLRWSRL